MNVLLDLHEEHTAQFEHELIRLGLRWRDFPSPGFTWRDLVVIVTCADADGPLKRAMHPQGAASSDTLLLRSVEHSLRWLVWSKTTDAKYGRPPQMWRFEWEDDEDHGYRTDSMTPQQVNRALGWEDLIEHENRRRAEVGQPLVPTT